MPSRCRSALLKRSMSVDTIGNLVRLEDIGHFGSGREIGLIG